MTSPSSSVAASSLTVANIDTDNVSVLMRVCVCVRVVGVSFSTISYCLH